MVSRKGLVTSIPVGLLTIVDLDLSWSEEQTITASTMELGIPKKLLLARVSPATFVILLFNLKFSNLNVIQVYFYIIVKSN